MSNMFPWNLFQNDYDHVTICEMELFTNAETYGKF